MSRRFVILALLVACRGRGAGETQTNIAPPAAELELAGRPLTQPERATQIAPSIYLAGRRADAYPHPDQFLPERWLGVRPDPYTWLPFGGGTRRCLGMAFAQFEMRIVLQTVVPRARLQLARGPSRVMRRGITLAPSGGTRVVLSARAGRGSSSRPGRSAPGQR